MAIEAVYRRRLQVTGGGTYIVALPKEWVRSVGLGKGSEVVIEVLPDGSLRLTPAERVERRRVEATIKLSDSDSVGKAVRTLVAVYLAGADSIRILFSTPRASAKLARELREFIERRMIGVEVIEESSTEMLLQCMTGYASLPVGTAMRRMARTVEHMLEDLRASVEGGNRELLPQVIERDDIVDKFYLFLVRQINAVMQGVVPPSRVGLRSYAEAASIRMAAKSIERMGDHAYQIASELAKLSPPGVEAAAKLLPPALEEAQSLFKTATRSLLERRVEEAHRVVDRVLELRRTSLRVPSGLGEADAQTLRMAYTGVRRLYEYAADIAELAINIAALEELTSRGTSSEPAS